MAAHRGLHAEVHDCHRAGAGGRGVRSDSGRRMLVDDSAPPPSPRTGPSGPSDAADAAAPAPEFPCQVRAVLETYCAPCHAGTTYTVELKTREALLRPWGDAGTFGQHAATLVMMAQMPPTSAARFPTADERVILIDWV